MAYAYADKEEEEYYTQWIKDIQTKAFNDGANSAKKECTKKLASMGVDTNLLMEAFGLTPKEMQDILGEKS
ncbi:MAG: hypothetical protein IJU76_05540 [Desulfovibrionaceae bacterium]|nr:hypothetical protein [Desulfovibrionaceae bacterium]